MNVAAAAAYAHRFSVIYSMCVCVFVVLWQTVLNTSNAVRNTTQSGSMQLPPFRSHQWIYNDFIVGRESTVFDVCSY